MLPFLPVLWLAQAAPAPAPSPVPSPTPQTVVRPQEVRPLPGSLNSTLVFNSNSPEVVQTEGILLSTLSPQGKRVPSAHLDQLFQGQFDIFAHHIAKAESEADLKTLYLGVLLHNPGKQAVTVTVSEAASYLSQPDAPFVKLPPYTLNRFGDVYAGPGDRVMNMLLRGQRQPGWPSQIVLPPGESRMLMNLPIPVKGLTPPINGRSTLARLHATGPVQIASLARFAPKTARGEERPPTLPEWETLLRTGGLAGPRDKAPTPPGAKGSIIYGRVAGVARGSQWQAQVSDRGATGFRLTIPQPGAAFSYGLSLLQGGTFGTGQVQSAPLIARYPDTAYQAHGNYGVKYNLTLPLYNPTNQTRLVSVAIETPVKSDKADSGLTFMEPLPPQVFFRGTVRLRFQDDQGTPRTRYVHLVQQRGQQGEPLATLAIRPGDIRLVQVELLYPPDATPPQVLTVRTLNR